jgi:hypothetical protein
MTAKRQRGLVLSLTFDPALLNEPEEMRVKVFLHELLHMRYPNHGKMFEMMLQTYLRKEMNGEQY